MKNTLLKLASLLVALVLALSFAAALAEPPVLRIGSKDFTESLVVAEIYALALEDAGYKVERKFGIAGSIIHAAITNNEIDLYPEYTGTGLLAWLEMDLITEPLEVYETVKREYADRFQITWLDFSTANDGQGLVIRTQVAEKYGIATISDLQKHATELRFCTQGEFDERPDGLPGLIAKYGPFDWKESGFYNNALKYSVLANDLADVAPAYTTEGALVETDKFTLLEDDLYVWPPYNLVPVVRNDVLDDGIAAALNKVSQSLDTATLTLLNAQVDLDKLEVDEVAKAFFDSIK